MNFTITRNSRVPGPNEIIAQGVFLCKREPPVTRKYGSAAVFPQNGSGSKIEPAMQLKPGLIEAAHVEIGNRQSPRAPPAALKPMK